MPTALAAPAEAADQSTAVVSRSPLLVDQTAAINWITDRVKGVAAGSNCATMPAQP